MLSDLAPMAYPLKTETGSLTEPLLPSEAARVRGASEPLRRRAPRKNVVKAVTSRHVDSQGRGGGGGVQLSSELPTPLPNFF